MPKRFDLIVFDWDGTLADSTAMIVDCIREASLDVGLVAPAITTARNVIGLGLREAVLSLFGNISPTKFQELTDRYRLHYFQRDRQTPLYDGVHEALAELNQQGFKLAVATGKGRKGLNLSLQISGLANYFHATRCVDECHSKPHPQMLQQLMEELEVLPENTLMVGDTTFDLQMAQNAHVASLAVSYGAHSLEQLLVHEPLTHFDNFTKLKQWLIMNA